MLRKVMVLAIAISGVGLAADPTPIPPGSKLKKGLMDYLPNFAEANFVVSLANIYMQASSLVRSVNATVMSMNNAVTKLEEARETAQKLWGDVDRLRHINIYDMDSWAEGLSTLRYEIVGMDLIGINTLLTQGALSALDGTLGGYVKVQNGLSYDAREIGLNHAFTAYYYQEDWATYKAEHGFEQQSADVQGLLNNYEALKIQRENLRNWVCPEGTSKAQCDQMIEENKIKVDAINEQMDGINDDINAVSDKVNVSQLTRNSRYLQLDYIESALRKIHLSAEDYSTAYQQINNASAALARKAMKFITGRITSPSRDPEPRPSSVLNGPSEEELCARPENQVTKPDGTTTCIYSSTDRNKTATPKEVTTAADINEVEPDNEKPRDASMADFQKLKAEIAYINLQQEQLLFDMEMDQAYLELAQISYKTTKIMDHRDKLRTVQEGLGLAATIGDANSFTSDDIRQRHNSHLKPGVPWNMNESFEVNLAK